MPQQAIGHICLAEGEEGATFVFILQWAACHNVSLHNGDCKSAFLQGEPDNERPVQIYMKPPQDPIAVAAVREWAHPLLVYALTAPVYGQAKAPRRSTCSARS